MKKKGGKSCFVCHAQFFNINQLKKHVKNSRRCQKRPQQRPQQRPQHHCVTSQQRSVASSSRDVQHIRGAHIVTTHQRTRQPLDVILALDTSKSMICNEDGQCVDAPNRRIDKAIQGVNATLDALDGRCDRVCLLTFSDVVQKHTPNGLTQVSSFKQRVDSIPEPNGGTALYDCILQSLKLFQQSRGSKKQLELVVFTDGEDTRSNAKLSQVCAALAKPGLANFHLILMVVGVDNATQRVLKSLCKPRHCVYVPVDKSKDAIQKAFYKHVIKRFLKVPLSK